MTPEERSTVVSKGGRRDHGSLWLILKKSPPMGSVGNTCVRRSIPFSCGMELTRGGRLRYNKQERVKRQELFTLYYCASFAFGSSLILLSL